jgi:hypothetical protein
VPPHPRSLSPGGDEGRCDGKRNCLLCSPKNGGRGPPLVSPERGMLWSQHPRSSRSQRFGRLVAGPRRERRSRVSARSQPARRNPILPRFSASQNSWRAVYTRHSGWRKSDLQIFFKSLILRSQSAPRTDQFGERATIRAASAHKARHSLSPSHGRCGRNRDTSDSRRPRSEPKISLLLSRKIGPVGCAPSDMPLKA